MHEIWESVRHHLLTIAIFAPSVGAILILFVPRRSHTAVKLISVFATLVALIASLLILKGFRSHPSSAMFQFANKAPWIPAFDIQYYVAVDGISVTMVVLSCLLSFLCIFASWNIEEWHTNKGIKGYFALFLLLETGMTGVFCALDFFLFYVFWEVMLLPMYFLIGIWGGPRREYAAIKFFLYTLLGSVLMLVVMLALYFSTRDPETGRHTFDITVMATQGKGFTGVWWRLAFIALYIGFAIKVPVFPFHTWLPDAHVEAPTPISVILAGVLLKMGPYGLLRISYPILPEAARWFAPVLMVFGVINIIYGSLCAMAQIRGVPRVNPQTGEMGVERDWKKLIAYSSVAHMGFCLLGMAACNPAGLAGCLFQMWNHGIITGMLFLIVGVLYDRAHSRDVDGFGGLWKTMPEYGSITALAFMASLGLPGLAGFVSEILCFFGAFQASDPHAIYFKVFGGGSFYRVLTAVSVLGVVLGAAYFLWSYQKIFLGPLNKKWEHLPDLTVREKFTLWPLAALAVVLGIFPSPYLDLVNGAVVNLAKTVAMPWMK